MRWPSLQQPAQVVRDQVADGHRHQPGTHRREAHPPRDQQRQQHQAAQEAAQQQRSQGDGGELEEVVEGPRLGEPVEQDGAHAQRREHHQGRRPVGAIEPAGERPPMDTPILRAAGQPEGRQPSQQAEPGR